MGFWFLYILRFNRLIYVVPAFEGRKNKGLDNGNISKYMVKFNSELFPINLLFKQYIRINFNTIVVEWTGNSRNMNMEN